MIEGIIEFGLHPRLLLEIAGEKEIVHLPMLVDTGFNLDVALHFDFADRLDLEIYGTSMFEYANGQMQDELICKARVRWHGEWKDVDVVLTASNEPAIGTRLFSGCLLNMDFIKNIFSIEKPRRNFE